MATGGPPKINNEDPAIEQVPMASDGTNIASASSALAEPIAGTSESLIVISGDVDNENIEVTADWAQYTPSMMRGAIHPCLRAPSPCQVDQDAGQEEQQPPSPTPLPETPDYPPATATTQVQHRAPSTSRRRPTLRCDREAENLSAHRIETLSLANTQAAEEHEIKMRILRLQEKEKEILKQERLKTRQKEIKFEILESQLR